MEAIVPDPVADLQHAHDLLALMSPEELHKATYALEEIIEDSVWFKEKMRKEIAEAEAGGWVSSDQLLDALGFESAEFPGLAGSPDAHNEAA